MMARIVGPHSLRTFLFEDSTSWGGIPKSSSLRPLAQRGDPIICFLRWGFSFGICQRGDGAASSANPQATRHGKHYHLLVFAAARALV